MTEVHTILFRVGMALMVALVVGIVWRQKLAQVVTFSLYIGVATTWVLTIFVYPDFNTPETYMVKQGIYDSLLFGMALEISGKSFAAFRGIAARVRTLLALAVAASSIGILLLTPASQQYSDIGRYQPGITTAGIWCLSFVALLVVWYQIPVPSFTRAIMLGYVPYLVIFVTCMDLLARRGWSFVQNVNVINAAAYDLTAGYLAYAAWRKD